MSSCKLLYIATALLWATLISVASAAAAPAKASSKSAADNEIERGRYIVAISGCNDCHTHRFLLSGGKTPEKEWLTGSTMGWRGPWGTTYATNLRLYFQEITEEQWVQVAKEIQRRPPMPYYSLNAMTEADVRALYKYVRSLGPAGNPAPKFVPADKAPPQPFVQFP